MPTKRSIFLLIFDVIAINLAYILAFNLRFDMNVPEVYMQTFLRNAWVLTLLKVGAFSVFRLYKVMWRYANLQDVYRFIITVAFGNILCYGYLNAIKSGLPRSSFAMALILDIVIMGAMRLVPLAYRQFKTSYKPKSDCKQVMIIGAGEAGILVFNELKRHPEILRIPVVFIDDDVSKQGKNINGIPVYGGKEKIEEAARRFKISEIIVALPSVSPEDRQEILMICEKTTAKMKIVPGYYQFINNKMDLKNLRDVQIEDLLGRDEVVLDQGQVKKFIVGKRVMVTGGGGSIGSELCRQIAKFDPEELFLLDIYENNAYDIQNELKRVYPTLNLKVLIESVRDAERIDQVFRQYKPEIVFHAAAHKHVPLMEDSAQSAIKNNVFGTYNVASACDVHQVEKMVLISTDKAVNPTNVMGATKRVCEMIVQTFDERSKTEFVAVRFGNVLGSNGSVIPLFKRQIANGGPVTVTHKDITRYFMTIPEASQLVLQAGSMANGGEIFILDMGDEVKIYDLAERLIRLSGHTPGGDMEIKVTGLRPGEKLYEELLLNKETSVVTAHKKIHVEIPEEKALIDLDKHLKKLDEVSHQEDIETIRKALEEVVPTYHPYIPGRNGPKAGSDERVS